MVEVEEPEARGIKPVDGEGSGEIPGLEGEAAGEGLDDFDGLLDFVSEAGDGRGDDCLLPPSDEEDRGDEMAGRVV